MYDNKPISNTNSNNQASHRPNAKLVVIAVVILLVLVGAIITIASLSSGQEQPSAALYYPRTNTLTLQIYTALNDEMSFEDLEQTVHSVDPEAQITKENGFGNIKSSDGDHQIIYFYFDSDDAETTDDEAEDEGEEEYPSDFTAEHFGPNIAYDFRFVFDTSRESSPSIYKDYSTSTYHYDDGGYTGFDFETKQEVIDAYLSPEVNE